MFTPWTLGFPWPNLTCAYFCHMGLVQPPTSLTFFEAAWAENAENAVLQNKNGSGLGIETVQTAESSRGVFPLGMSFFDVFLVWIFFGFWNFCQFWGVSWPETKNGKLENLNSAKLEITSSQGPCLILSLYLQLVYQSVTEIPKRAGKLLVWWHLAWLTSFFLRIHLDIAFQAATWIHRVEMKTMEARQTKIIFFQQKLHLW